MRLNNRLKRKAMKIPHQRWHAVAATGLVVGEAVGKAVGTIAAAKACNAELLNSLLQIVHLESPVFSTHNSKHG